MLTYTLEEATELVSSLCDVQTELDSKERQRLRTDRRYEHLVLRHVTFLTGTKRQRKQCKGRDNSLTLSSFSVPLSYLIECQNALHLLQVLLRYLQVLFV